MITIVMLLHVGGVIVGTLPWRGDEGACHEEAARRTVTEAWVKPRYEYTCERR
jgi:hypothetical protein